MVFEKIWIRICTVWRKLGLVTQTLAVIEPLCYGLAVWLLANNAGWLYFVGTGSIALLGVLVSKQTPSDAGRTISQLYMIDVFFHIFGVGYYLFVQDDLWFSRCKFSYEAINTGLSLAKVLAISTAVGVPGQAGWPKLVPFITHVRDIQGTKKLDMTIYAALVASILFGFWLQAYEIRVNSAIWIVPALLFIIIDATKIKSAKAIEELSPRAKDLAIKFDGFPPEEKDLTENIMDTVLRAKRKVATNDSTKGKRK